VGCGGVWWGGLGVGADRHGGSQSRHGRQVQKEEWEQAARQAVLTQLMRHRSQAVGADIWHNL